MVVVVVLWLFSETFIVGYKLKKKKQEFLATAWGAVVYKIHFLSLSSNGCLSKQIKFHVCHQESYWQHWCFNITMIIAGHHGTQTFNLQLLTAGKLFTMLHS